MHCLARAAIPLIIVTATLTACAEQSSTPPPPPPPPVSASNSISVRIAGGLADTLFVPSFRVTGDVVAMPRLEHGPSSPMVPIASFVATLDLNSQSERSVQGVSRFVSFTVQDSSRANWTLDWPDSIALGRHTLTVIVTDVRGAADTTIATFVVAAPIARYTATILRTLSGDTVHAMDINNRGEIAGYLTDAKGRSRAVVWRNGEPTVLAAPDTTSYQAVAINDAGIVIGIAMPGFPTRVVRWNAAGVPTFLGMSAAPIDINSAGDVLLLSNGGTLVLTGAGSISLPSIEPASLNDRLELVGAECDRSYYLVCTPKYAQLGASAPSTAAARATTEARYFDVDQFIKITNRRHILRSDHVIGNEAAYQLIRLEKPDTLDLQPLIGLKPPKNIRDVNDDDVLLIMEAYGNTAWLAAENRLARIVIVTPGVNIWYDLSPFVFAFKINNVRQILAHVRLSDGSETFALLTPAP